MNEDTNSHTDLTPGTIYCIGRNYAKHAQELGNDIPDKPLVFLKPRSALSMHPAEMRIPDISNDVHHELELVLSIGKRAKDISTENALNVIEGFAVGIDFTARDIQSEAKKAGLPWTLAKGFDGFAPVSPFVPFRGQHLQSLEIILNVNGTQRQKGNTKDMIFPIADLISYLSSTFTLLPGDLIFTGTPSGVAKVESGDLLEATITGFQTQLSVQVL